MGSAKHDNSEGGHALSGKRDNSSARRDHKGKHASSSVRHSHRGRHARKGKRVSSARHLSKIGVRQTETRQIPTEPIGAQASFAAIMRSVRIAWRKIVKTVMEPCQTDGLPTGLRLIGGTTSKARVDSAATGTMASMVSNAEIESRKNRAIIGKALVGLSATEIMPLAVVKVVIGTVLVGRVATALVTIGLPIIVLRETVMAQEAAI